jgi:hypothetical protein
MQKLAIIVSVAMHEEPVMTVMAARPDQLVGVLLFPHSSCSEPSKCHFHACLPLLFFTFIFGKISPYRPYIVPAASRISKDAV